MSFEIVDIDHLMIRVGAFDAGVEAFRALGFTVTPPRRHIDMSALSESASSAPSSGGPGKATINNRHILFRPFPGRDDVANFLELMCIEDQGATPPPVIRLLAFLLDSEGPKTVVCYSRDVDRSRESMRAQGIETAAPIPFETGWDDEERDRFVRIQARPAVPVYGQIPFQANPYETTTLDGYHYEPWTRHPNGARYMAGITGVTDRIVEDANAMAERVFGMEPEWLSEHVALIRPRDIFLRVVSPEGFAELYPGLEYSRERLLPALSTVTVAVESVERVRDLLDRARVEYIETPAGGIAVSRERAANTVVEFVAAVADRERSVDGNRTS